VGYRINNYWLSSDEDTTLTAWNSARIKHGEKLVIHIKIVFGKMKGKSHL